MTSFFDYSNLSKPPGFIKLFPGDIFFARDSCQPDAGPEDDVVLGWITKR